MRKLLLFLFSHRLLAIARWDLGLLRLRARNALTFRNGAMRRYVASRGRPLYLNLGSGPRGLADERWVNVDGFPDRNVRFLLDLGRMLPFPGESFDGIFCEHVLEHFSLGDGEALAREARRMLRPGGCLRIVVPDAELILRMYVEAPHELLAWGRGSGGETPVEIVNAYFRQRYEHQFLHDFRSLEAMLRRAGFAGVARVDFGAARACPAIALDDAKYRRESLYVEAVRH